MTSDTRTPQPGGPAHAAYGPDAPAPAGGPNTTGADATTPNVNGSNAQAAGPPGPAAPERRALVVDDERVIRQALRRFFQRQGWAVDDAENGAEALALLLAEGAPRYDVIISDLRMPDISGMELYERLAAARPALLQRLILSTGDSVSPEASDFLRRSACPVLNKPFELAELRALVGRVVAVAA